MPDLDEDKVLEMTQWLLEMGTVRLHAFNKKYPGTKKVQLERHFSVTPVEGVKNQWEVALL